MNTLLLILFFSQTSCLFAKYFFLASGQIFDRKNSYVLRKIRVLCEEPAIAGSQDENTVCGVSKTYADHLPVSDSDYKDLSFPDIPIYVDHKLVDCAPPKEGQTINLRGIEIKLIDVILQICTEKPEYYGKTEMGYQKSFNEEKGIWWIADIKLKTDDYPEFGIQPNGKIGRYITTEPKNGLDPILQINGPYTYVSGVIADEEDRLAPINLDPNSSKYGPYIRFSLFVRPNTRQHLTTTLCGIRKARVRAIFLLDNFPIAYIRKEDLDFSTSPSFGPEAIGCVPGQTGLFYSPLLQAPQTLSIDVRLSCLIEQRVII